MIKNSASANSKRKDNMQTHLGVSNCPLKFSSAPKIGRLLDLLTKFACLCSQNFYNCSHARILVKIFSIV